MELRQLRYFLRVAETLHFGRAAQLEHIAPSVISTQISRLEGELGVALFTRSTRSVELTQAGRTLREHADRLLRGLDLGVEATRDAGGASPTSIRVGAFSTDPLTHRIISVFLQRHSSIRLTFTELTMTNQVTKILNGDVDVAFVWLPVTDERLHVDQIYEDPTVALIPQGHRLASASHVHTSDLLDESFAVPTTAPAEWRSHWSLDSIRGRAPRVGAVVESMHDVLAAVAYGGVIDTATLNSARMSPHPGVAFVPIADSRPSTLALISAKDTGSRAVALFREVVHETVSSHITAIPGAVPISA